MLYANILVPAKVLRAAVEAKATTFVNLGSALQLDPEKALNAPDYASTKQAFRAFLSHQSSRLHTTSVFVNEIFGVGDTRRKLLNQAIDCAINNVHMTVQSAHRVLGFANVSRLASEIVSLLKNPASRPEEYVYQNYSNITLGEVLDTVGLLAGGLSWSESSQEEVPASVTSLESLGERAKKNFSIEIRDVLEFKKSHTV
jgi:nucleoside-diphosphate-sugar epimerase